MANGTINYTAPWWLFIHNSTMALHLTYGSSSVSQHHWISPFTLTEAGMCIMTVQNTWGQRHFEITYWKFTLSTWNLVSKIPEVRTLHLSRSWKRWAQNMQTVTKRTLPLVKLGQGWMVYWEQSSSKTLKHWTWHHVIGHFIFIIFVLNANYLLLKWLCRIQPTEMWYLVKIWYLTCFNKIGIRLIHMRISFL